MTPVSFIGSDRLEAVRFRGQDVECDLPAQLAVTCIGYQADACCSISPANGVFASDNGKIRDALYVVGWAKRGATGTIPTNRSEAQLLAQRMAKEVTDSGRAGRLTLTDHLQAHGRPFVDYAGWKRIDAAEIARADSTRCREKINTVDEMLEIAGFRDRSERPKIC